MHWALFSHPNPTRQSFVKPDPTRTLLLEQKKLNLADAIHKERVI